MNCIHIGHEPIHINTPYGTVYIEAAQWQYAKPELILTVYVLQEEADLQLDIQKCEQQEALDEKSMEFFIDTSTTKPPKSVMPPIKEIDTSELKTPKPIIDKDGNLL